MDFKTKLGVLAGALVMWMFCISSWVAMLCWNYLAPVFGMPILGFWQMLVLRVLIDLLFRMHISVDRK